MILIFFEASVTLFTNNHSSALLYLFTNIITLHWNFSSSMQSLSGTYATYNSFTDPSASITCVQKHVLSTDTNVLLADVQVHTSVSVLDNSITDSLLAPLPNRFYFTVTSPKDQHLTNSLTRPSNSIVAVSTILPHRLAYSLSQCPPRFSSPLNSVVRSSHNKIAQK